MVALTSTAKSCFLPKEIIPFTNNWTVTGWPWDYTTQFYGDFRLKVTFYIHTTRTVRDPVEVWSWEFPVTFFWRGGKECLRRLMFMILKKWGNTINQVVVSNIWCFHPLPMEKIQKKLIFFAWVETTKLVKNQKISLGHSLCFTFHKKPSVLSFNTQVSGTK